jgi:hypothetical protein
VEDIPWPTELLSASQDGLYLTQSVCSCEFTGLSLASGGICKLSAGAPSAERYGYVRTSSVRWLIAPASMQHTTHPLLKPRNSLRTCALLFPRKSKRLAHDFLPPAAGSTIPMTLSSTPERILKVGSSRMLIFIRKWWNSHKWQQTVWFQWQGCTASNYENEGQFFNNVKASNYCQND